jgi:hypothetical protein
MRLVLTGNQWQIEGEGSEQAVIAYAKDVDGKLVYELEPSIATSVVH